MTSNNSNPSSEVSIEEIGPEEVNVAVNAENAEEIITGPREEVNPSGDKETVPTTVAKREGDSDDDGDDFEDETIGERLLGLTEMFPESLRTGCQMLTNNTISGVKWMYDMSRTTTWIAFSSATFMFLPVMIETERMSIEEAQKQQQRKILLGPGAAVSGGQNAPLPQSTV